MCKEEKFIYQYIYIFKLQFFSYHFLAPATFDFSCWTAEICLDQKMINLLVSQDINNLSDLKRLSAKDINELISTIGQRNILKEGLQKIGVCPKDSPDGETSLAEKGNIFDACVMELFKFMTKKIKRKDVFC